MKRVLLLLLIIANLQLFSQTTINEGFEGTTFPPTGWNIHSPAGNLLWSKSSSLKHSGNYSIYLPNWNKSHIVSPMVNITSDQDSLTFWTNYSVNYGTGILTIYASTSGQTFNDIPDTANFIKRELISSSSSGWVRKAISLKNYIGQSIYLTIQYDSWSTTMNIDDISISTANKPSVSTIKQSNVTQVSATLNGNFFNYDNEITAKGFIWRNANNSNWDTVLISSDTLKYNISNLIEDTKYEYKAFILTNTDTTYGKLLYFYTNINPNKSIPLFESFEDSIFPSNGWKNLADSSWNTAWARSSDSKRTGNYSAFRSYWNGSLLVSPLVKVEKNFDTLSFWYNSNSYNNGQSGKLWVYVSDSCDFNNCRDYSNLALYKVINSNTSGWVNIKIPLAKYIDQKVHIGILYHSWTYQFYLDDISGVLYADSTKSSNVTTKTQTDVTLSSATLNGNFFNYDNEITAKGFIWRNANSNNFDTIYIVSDTLKSNLSNLYSNTKYEYKAFIKTNTDFICGDLLYFYTNINPNISLPLFESFEDSIFPSNGWKNLADSSLDIPWIKYNNLSNTGNNSAFCSYWNDAWLISPLVKIENIYDTLSFWYNASTYNNGQHGKLYVYISDSCDFSNCRDTNGLVYLDSIDSYDCNGWMNIKISLNNYINKEVYIGIRYDSWTYRLNIDDISGVLYADSLKTITPTIDTITYNSANFSWQKYNANHWRLQLTLDSLDWDNTIHDTIISDTTILINNLNPKTNYKFRIKADYGDNIASSWSNTIQFTTLDNVSIENTIISKISLSIIPNPAKSQTTINIDNIFGEVNISIYNIHGVIVKTFNETTNGSLNKTIDLESFEEGVYFVRIENKGAIKTEKLIIK
ncbi:MAG: hypothetical protein H6Q15_1699 [Bacteroidetes bacterium]|nr:hypothetical protein [Bacteroidota bacterium]